jgi:membrane protein
LFLFAALFFMIRFIPAGRVTSISALVGAVCGAVLWEIARGIFVFWVSYVLRLSVIYGSLAVIPIFLIWIYLAWSIVLLSLEIAYIHQHRGRRIAGTSLWEREPAEVLRCGLELYLTVALEFAAGAKPPSAAYLAGQIGIAERDILRLIDKFSAANLLIAVGGKNGGYVPSRDLSGIQTEEVTRCVLGAIHSSTDPGRLHQRLYERIMSSGLESIRGSNIKDIISSEDLTLPEPAHTQEDAAEKNRTWFRRLFGK